MTDPRIQRITEAVDRLAQGKFDLQLPDGQDEIGRLGGSLSHLAEVLELRFRELNRLSEITGRVNSGVLIDEVLEHVYATFHALIPYDRIGFSLIHDGRTVRARWARSNAAKILLRAGYSAPLAGSSLEVIVKTGQPRILNDLREYLAAHPNSESTRLIVQEGVRSSLTCPLLVEGKAVGFLFFSSAAPNTYRDAHVGVYQQIAAQLAVTVEKARLYEHVVELNLAKNKMIGMVSHDLRSPIATIRGLAALVQKERVGPLNEKQRDLLGRIDRISKTMLTLIGDLVEVSSIQAGHLDLQRAPIAVAGMLDRAAADARILAESKSIEIQVDAAADLPVLSLDERRMGQVLDNLLSNAIKYSNPGSVVTVRARHASDAVTIEVSDQGVGIPDEEREGLFESFRRGSNRPTGGESSTGLGLAIVRHIVTSHEGRIEVQSEVGKGSVFTVTLPIPAPSLNPS